MKAFLFIMAALILPFGAIGSFTYATFLSMRDGAAAGTLPAWLFSAGIVMVIIIGWCIFSLNRLYTSRRNGAAQDD